MRITSPVRILRSNCRSVLTSINLRSAGTFSPILIVIISPGTRFLASTLVYDESRRTNTSDGSIPLIDAITREVEKSCQALKTAWISNTRRRTTARARLEACGSGSPRGFLDVESALYLITGGCRDVSLTMQ